MAGRPRGQKRMRPNVPLTSGPAYDTFSIPDDDADVQIGHIGTPTFVSSQVVIPTVPVAVPYNQVMASPATISTPPRVSQSPGSFAAPVSLADQIAMHQPAFSLPPDILLNFSLVDEEHQQAICRILQFHFQTGNGMTRESIHFFCEGLVYSVRNAQSAIQDNVTRAENDIRAEYSAKITELESKLTAKDEEIEQLKQERNAEATKASRLSEQVDMDSVNEAGLRNELESCNAALRSKEAGCGRMESEISELKDKAEQDRTRITTLEEDLAKLKEENENLNQTLNMKRDEVLKLKTVVDQTSQYVDIVRGLCQQGGPFFDFVKKCTVECPVLCNTGAIIPYKTLLETWVATDGYMDGTAGRTFSCANTNNATTSVAQRTHVELIYHLSQTIGVCKKALPCVVEYLYEDVWTPFALYDTLEVMSRVCRIYRKGIVGDDDTFMLGGRLVFSFVLQSDGDGKRKLMISIQDYTAGASYEGRLRTTDATWNVFPDMVFRD